MFDDIVSVVIPVYNVVNYLSHCLESVCRSSYENIEIILVDDGSTDGSAALCDEWGKRDARIRVVHQSNGGLSAARNAGISCAKGAYIAFVDGDDYIHPQLFEILLFVAKSHDYDISMVLGKSTIRQDEPIKRISDCHISEKKQQEMMEGLFANSGIDIQYQVVWNKLYSRELIADVLRFRQTTSEDTDFNVRAFLATEKIGFAPEYLYFYVMRGSSLSHQIYSRNFIGNLDSYSHIISYLQDNDYYRSLCLWKLFKKILNVRYHSSSDPSEDNRWFAKEKVYEVYNNNKQAFFDNRYITVQQKAVFSLLYKVPLLYKLMLYYNGQRMKPRNH